MSAPRLYLVAPPVVTEAALAALRTLMDAHDIACIRIAPAGLTEDEIKRQADPVRALAHERDVNVVLTDHVRLAGALGLDGVHLSAGARHVREARRALGPDAIVGAFCGASRHEGMNAAEMGADYVAFGPLGPSPLHDGEPAPPDLFAWWSEMIETPLVAEGAVTPERAAVIAATADFLAIGPELWADAAGPDAALAAIVARLPAG